AAEALAGILAEAVAGASATAGAVLEGADRPARALHGVEPEALRPFLAEGGVVRAAIRRQEEWADETLPLSHADGECGWSAGYDHLLLVPLRVRGLSAGTLALLYAPGAPPTPQDSDAAAVYGALAALVLEHDRLYEEAREARQ